MKNSANAAKRKGLVERGKTKLRRVENGTRRGIEKRGPGKESRGELVRERTRDAWMGRRGSGIREGSRELSIPQISLPGRSFRSWSACWSWSKEGMQAVAAMAMVSAKRRIEGQNGEGRGTWGAGAGWTI